MFGYIRPYRPTLLVADDGFYRAVYCGLCRRMKALTGRLSTASLSYDLVTLALVRMLYDEQDAVRLSTCRCIAHPFRRRQIVSDSPGLDYAARVSAVLAYHKLKDDIADTSSFARFGRTLISPVFSHAEKKADLSDLSAKAEACLTELTQVERERTASIDIPAAIFGRLLGDVFAYGTEGSDALVLRTLGESLGRFIYCSDAAEDYEDDRKSGSYNPYVLLYPDGMTPDIKKSIHTALLFALKTGEGAMNLLPYGTHHTVRRLLENTFYEGLPHRISFLLTDTPACRSCEKRHPDATIPLP